MWKRYQYTGEGELLVLETSEGAKILSPSEKFLMSDEYDLTGRPFKPVGGAIKENGDTPPPDDPPPAEPAATDPSAASPEATPVAQEGSN